MPRMVLVLWLIVGLLLSGCASSRSSDPSGSSSSDSLAGITSFSPGGLHGGGKGGAFLLLALVAVAPVLVLGVLTIGAVKGVVKATGAEPEPTQPSPEPVCTPIPLIRLQPENQ